MVGLPLALVGAMSVKDARIAATLPSHPKTKKLLRELGPEGCWYLVRLFLWASTDRSSGDLSGLADDDLELAVDWPGATGRFIAALARVGFVDGVEGERRIHDWAEHNPWAAGAPARSTKARWNAAKRHHGEAAADLIVPGYRAASTAASIATSNAPLPSPLPSKEQQQGSTALPSTDLLGPPPLADLKAARAQRLAQVTCDAIETFNASKLVKGNGGLLPNINHTVGREKREQQVARCIRTARQICGADYGSETITREFWADYWESCFADDHKAGRAGGGKDHPTWKPSFEYLTREATMLAVYDHECAAGVA